MTVYEPIDTFLLQMPDIAATAASIGGETLDWVGMQAIHLPFTLRDENEGAYRATAVANVFVDLCDTTAKGIHMSRLYLNLTQYAENQSVSPFSLQTLLGLLHESHAALSQQAAVVIKFEYYIQRGSLKSDNLGWRSYPVTLVASRNSDGEVSVELAMQIQYSSTCPCSAALARQLIVQQFNSDFADKESLRIEDVQQWLSTEQGILATPHSQRSTATVKVKLNETNAEALPLTALIDCVEGTLKTPVQAAVKREDEQEFARKP
jgi:GTP cyclohydrolase I